MLRPLWRWANSKSTPQRSVTLLEVAEIAKVMLTADAPCVSNHAMWYLAQLALAQGDAMAAHEWLCSKGLDERLSVFPLFPHEVTDDAGTSPDCRRRF